MRGENNDDDEKYGDNDNNGKYDNDNDGKYDNDNDGKYDNDNDGKYNNDDDEKTGCQLSDQLCPQVYFILLISVAVPFPFFFPGPVFSFESRSGSRTFFFLN